MINDLQAYIKSILKQIDEMKETIDDKMVSLFGRNTLEKNQLRLQILNINKFSYFSSMELIDIN